MLDEHHLPVPGAEDHSKAWSCHFIELLTVGTGIVGELGLVGEFGRPNNMF